MIVVPVNKKEEVEVVFEMTGEAVNILSYYIRKIKLQISKNSIQKDQALSVCESLAAFSSPELSSSSAELLKMDKEGDYYHLWVYPQRVNGFHSLYGFQPAVGVQYRQLLEKLEPHIDKEIPYIKMTMYVDVIY